MEGISKMGDREEMLYFPASHSIFSYRWVTILHPSGILLSWNKFNPEALKKKRLIFLCNTAWPRHKLGDRESWPENGRLNYNTILHLDLFCRKLKKKWTELPYVPAFMALRDDSVFHDSCKTDLSVLALSTHPHRGLDLGDSPADVL